MEDQSIGAGIPEQLGETFPYTGTPEVSDTASAADHFGIVVSHHQDHHHQHAKHANRLIALYLVLIALAIIVGLIYSKLN